MTLPRPPSNWSLSPLARRNSDPASAWMDGEGRGRENRSMHGWATRDGRGFQERKEEGKYDHCRLEDEGGGVIGRMMGVMRKGRVWNMHGREIR